MIARGKERFSQIATRLGLAGSEISRSGQDGFVAYHERVLPKPSTAMMFDIASINERFLRAQLGPDYVSPIRRYLDTGTRSLFSGREKAVERFLHENPKCALPLGAFMRLKNHGNGVRWTMEKIRERLGYKGKVSGPDMEPLQNYMYFVFETDEFGNWGMTAHLKNDEMSKTLDNRSEGFINISWQWGPKMRVIQFDASGPVSPPRFEVDGGYMRDRAERNLSNVGKLASAHLEKVFILAGGNHGDNPGHVFETRPDILPDNVFLVGEWIEDGNGGAPANNVYNLKLYVPNGAFHICGGSSQSAGAITEISTLFALLHGLDHDPKTTVRTVIEEFTEERWYKAPRYHPETNLPISGAFDIVPTRVLVPQRVDKEFMIA